MKKLIYILSVFLCTSTAFCYGNEYATTADGLALTEILSQAGVAGPNEVILSSDESIVTETLTILLEMLESVCTANPDGCNNGSDETVNAILDMIKQILSIYNDTTTTTTGENEPSEATATGVAESSSEIPEGEPFEMEAMSVPPPLLLHCPDDHVRPSWLEELSHYPTNKEILETLAFTTSGYVELQEITDSLFLDPNIVYYVPDPPLLIHGEGVHVVIPSDTLIIVAEEWEYSIVVYDGAKIDLGEPAPVTGDPNFIYQQPDINPPVWIVGESGEPFFNNYCGILITRTASTECRLNNLYLEGFYHGALIDQQLEEPISNAYANGCYNGFFSFGSNRFINCYTNYFGIWTPEYPYDGHGFLFDVYSMNMTLLTDNEFQIDYCLANDGERGYTVYGATDPNSIPIFRCWDSSATNTFVAFNGWEGQVLFSIVRPGMWNNDWDTNFPELPLNEPHHAPENPIQYDPNDYRIYLVADANFVDAGSGYSSNPGWTTRKDGKPDKGIADTWPHYPSDVIELSADITGDHEVDANDLVILTLNWLEETNDPVDITGNGLVNYLDFSWIAKHWQQTELYLELVYAEEGRSVDLKNISGYLGLQPKQIPLDAFVVTYYVDDTQVGGWLRGWNKTDQWVGFETDQFSNGWHNVRLVITSLSGVINHEPIQVYFNNLISKVSASDSFYPDEDYTYSGFYDGGQALEIEVTDLVSGAMLWSDTITGDYVDVTVPGSSFADYKLCRITFTETSGMKSASSGDKVTEKDLKKEFKKKDGPARMIIVMPDTEIFDLRLDAIIACAEACNDRGVTWIPLYHHDVNVENLTYLYQSSYVRYIYWVGHGNSHVGADPENQIEGVARTNNYCYRRNPAWWRPGYWDWDQIGCFSYTQQSDPEAEPLPGDHDETGFDLAALDMHESNNKKIVIIDACLSAVYEDMAWAYGVFSLQGQSSRDQLYIGWRCNVVVRHPFIDRITGNTTQGWVIFWGEMGKGQDVYEGFMKIKNAGGIGMQRAWFGENRTPDIADPTKDDNIMVYGNGTWDNATLNP